MKKSENPSIPEITTTYKKRAYSLSNLELPQGIYKRCVWCLGQLEGARRRWCGDECLNSALAWGNPQKEEGLGFLLIRQEFKCNVCAFDWGAVIEGLYLLPRTPYGLVEAKKTWRTKFSYYISRRLKMVMAETDPDHRPEVDHVLAISKGGQSIGLENVRVLCHLCHKAKTKLDNSGPRKKKVDKPDLPGDNAKDESNG